jgi:hypothetical protein
LPSRKIAGRLRRASIGLDESMIEHQRLVPNVSFASRRLVGAVSETGFQSIQDGLLRFAASSL